MTDRGTRLFWRPPTGNGTGAVPGNNARSHHPPKAIGDPPDLAGAGAPCTRPDADEDLWHPNGYTGPEKAQAEAAIALCNTCPVKDECLDWARRIRATHGVWGGVWIDNPDVRRARKRRRPA